jgi:hypothetical protein
MAGRQKQQITGSINAVLIYLTCMTVLQSVKAGRKQWVGEQEKRSPAAFIPKAFDFVNG